MGYTVFPLHGFDRDDAGRIRCFCSEGVNCPRIGKHPAIRWGELEPGARVLGTAGHGIATGAKSGIFVVDTDGPDADARFVAMGEIPETFTVRTPSGGRHYYFAHPGFPVRSSQGEYDRKPGEQTSHIDVRGDGGYIVTPGSPHKSGRTYDVERNVPVAPAPAWLLAWPGLQGRSVDPDAVRQPFPVDLESEIGKKRLELGREACATFPASFEGQNGSAALWAIALHLVRTLELPIDTCAELVATVYNPRCEPPWSPREVLHKLEDARDKSDQLPGDVTPIDTTKFSAPTPVRTRPRRRQKNTAHAYECRLSDVGNIQPSKTTVGNVLHILSANPSWDGVLQYDTFRDRIVAVDPPIPLEAEKTCFVERDVTAVRKWFETVGGLVVSKDTAWEASISVAHENRFHPVVEYLDALDPEAPELLEQAARICFGSDDPLDAVLMRKFMIGAVRRVLHPGEKMDTMLVLVGPQGAGKSTFVPFLFGPEFTSEDLADIKTKDAMIGLSGKWGIEVAELDKLLRTEPETVKAFISRCVDPYRAPYERVSTDHPRQCVYVGTSNKDDFLRDPTGERRYWIIDVRAHGVDLDAVATWRDRLWAAAYAVARLPKKEHPHWLSPEETAQLKARAALFKGEHGWTDAIMGYCIGRETVKVDEIFRHLGGTTDKLDDPRKVARIADILRDLGCERGVKAVGKQRVRVWFVPDDLRTSEVPEAEALRRQGQALVQGILNTKVPASG